MKLRAFDRGFTLIEILIALAIIGMFTAVVIGSTTASRGQVRDVRRITDMKEMQLGLALYYDVNKSYPSGGSVAVLDVLVTQKYLPEIPKDPAGGVYEYRSYNNNKSYCIGVKLEGTIPPDNVTSAMNSNCDQLTNSNYKASR